MVVCWQAVPALVVRNAFLLLVPREDAADMVEGAHRATRCRSHPGHRRAKGGARAERGSDASPLPIPTSRTLLAEARVRFPPRAINGLIHTFPASSCHA